MLYNKDASKVIPVGDKSVHVFEAESKNLDPITVASFGEEWSKFDSFNEDEISRVGDEYFDVVDFSSINKESTVALDVGCGTGRWSIYLCDKVKEVYAVDPSKAVLAAAKLTEKNKNIHLSQASTDSLPFNDNTFDFVFSLGVLHHIPDTASALNDIVKKLKPGGTCLLYLYYALDNRSFLYKFIFKCSHIFRLLICRMPSFLKKLTCDLIAILIYLPFITLSKIMKVIAGEKIAAKVPLSYYRNKSFNIVRNDALDRFGTPLEQRFSKKEITEMMENAGLEDLLFSDNTPYWHVTGKKTQ